jgi:hypothetical protein
MNLLANGAVPDHRPSRQAIEELLLEQIAAPQSNRQRGPECGRKELWRHCMRVTPEMACRITAHVWRLRALLASR